MTERVSRLQRVATLRVVEAPEPLLDLELAKRHIKIQHAEHDLLIQTYIDAALAAIDGPTGWCKRAIAPQTLELATLQMSGCYAADGYSASFIPGRSLVVDLPSPPVIEIVSVKYDTAAGDTVTLTAGQDYRLRRNACQFTAALPEHDELRIRYRAGFEPIATAPVQSEAREVERARIVAMLTVGDLYANRESQQTAPNFLEANPAIAALLPPKLLVVA